MLLLVRCSVYIFSKTLNSVTSEAFGFYRNTSALCSIIIQAIHILTCKKAQSEKDIYTTYQNKSLVKPSMLFEISKKDLSVRISFKCPLPAFIFQLAWWWLVIKPKHVARTRISLDFPCSYIRWSEIWELLMQTLPYHSSKGEMLINSECVRSPATQSCAQHRHTKFSIYSHLQSTNYSFYKSRWSHVKIS
jgi:hypothetical protein